VRVLGIDPGSRLTGWGVVETRGGSFRHVASGTIVLTPSAALGARLARLHAECGRLLAAWTPAAVVVERAFVARNVQSAFRLGEARGAVLAAAGGSGTPLHEYAPATVKLATVGYGQADKRAVGRGIALRLGLPRPPSADAADALALALCHLQHAPLLSRIDGAPAQRGRSSRNGQRGGWRGSAQRGGII
jgi:crossover junction endodeoxyribonuclease RuvC